MTASEDGSILSRRSSSQTSRLSSESKRNKPLLHRSRGSVSKSSGPASPKDGSLTSFPSFSPEQAHKEAAHRKVDPKLTRTVSQKARERKATLAGLTSGSPLVGQQHALFDDSPRSSIDVPGSLHLASDDHIKRLIARTGAVKLLRQFAQDLAQRDAELSALRNRADNRERELKRFLREVDVSSADVEKRLLRLEKSADPFVGADQEDTKPVRKNNTIDGLMDEAMSEELSPDRPTQPFQFPRRAFTDDVAATSTSMIHGKSESSSGRGPGSRLSSRKSSQHGSTENDESADADGTIKPRATSSKSKRLSGLEALFQPGSQPTSYFIGGPAKTFRKPKAVDEVSVRSNQSASSFASWTKLFGGSSQPRKDASGRPRSSSLRQEAQDDAESEEPALSNLSRVRTNPPTAIPKPSNTSGSTVKARPIGRQTPTATRLSTSPGHTRKDSNASDFPPTVEMESMIESSQLPPTMTPQHHEDGGLLTDRFGFIYDQRQKKRQAAAVLSHRKNKPSASETLASLRSRRSDDDLLSPGDSAGPKRPATPASIDEDNSKKSWQDYLTVSSTLNRGRPRELLFHTPSANAIVTVSTMEATGNITPPSRNRSGTISVSSHEARVLPAASQPSQPKQSDITVSSADNVPQILEPESDSTSEHEPVRMLLEQLNELHDSLQAEKNTKWNEFLRKARAERALLADKGSQNAPEADLLNGELIGIATLGRSSKTKAKYLQFKSLVLHGITTSLRPKIWSECAGASVLRIPGYYADLVARSEDGSDIDPEISTQIKADIRRTLPDNTFFRYGPGVPKLEELLRAYSLHNPRIGYCQGMNLITASLLLICVTSEDCFWLLVAIIDHILPSGYFDSNLLVSRADQIVLRTYVAEVLPKLDAKLQDLNVELEACTFHWFLSLYAGVLTGGEALYRIWDCVLCLNSSDTPNIFSEDPSLLAAAKSSMPGLPVDIPSLSAISGAGAANTIQQQPPTPTLANPPHTTTTSTTTSSPSPSEHDGTSSPFLFQLGLALLKLNETAILSLDSAAQVYSYINHNMTNHAISIDGLVQAAEALRTRVKRADVLERRRSAVAELSGPPGSGGGGAV